jgi:pilus assembly protein CpaF
MEGEIITIQDIFKFDRTGIGRSGKSLGRFRATGVRPKCAERLMASGASLPVEMFEHVHAVTELYEAKGDRR